MCPIELEKFKIPSKKNRHVLKDQPLPQHKRGERFLKGPIRLKWLTRAARLPGKSLHVGIVLWYWAGIKKSRTISLSNSAMKDFNVSRYAKMRALKHLESDGLVTLERHTGRAPVVTICAL